MNYLNSFKRWILARKEEINSQDKEFLLAVEQSAFRKIIKFVQEGINVNCYYPENYITALHIVAEKGDLTLLKILQSSSTHHLTINPVSIRGYTPLHLCCLYGRYEFAKVLIKAGANPNMCDNYQKNCLHLVVPSKHIRFVKLLIMHGTRINEKDFFGYTPLHLAVDTEFINMVILLLKNGANPNLKTDRMPLLSEFVLNCREQKQVAILKTLIKHGAQVNALEKHTKRNALHYAAISGNLYVGYVLLKAGCNPSAVDITNSMPEDVAFRHGHKEFDDLLRTFRLYGDVQFIPQKKR